MSKFTKIDIYIVAVDGKDEKAYLSEREANAFKSSLLKIRPDADVAVEKRIAHLTELKKTESREDRQE